jgi:dTDP-glucose 4,6-dehydratase
MNCYFITGGAGFIGSNFINKFFKEYDNKEFLLINLDALYYSGDINNINENVRNDKRYKFIQCNLQNYELLKYIIKNNTITHIIHFAAQSHVQKSFDDSLQYTLDNVIGTHNLLEVCRLHCPSLVKFIHVSTDEVYGESNLDNDEVHKTEQSLLCPTNPYAASKAAAEMLVNSYNHSFKMPIIITRGNNVYGPNQYPEKVIPKFIKQLINNEKLTIQGDGSCVRAFLHSDDTADAFIKILEMGKIGEIYNIGCDANMEYSILDIAQLLIKKIKGEHAEVETWIEYVEDRPFNDKRYYISNNKLKELGWNIYINLEEGIDELLR